MTFTGEPPVAHEAILRNIASARALGLPEPVEVSSHDRSLAVVGGGPSIKEHLDEIRAHDEIWAINGACSYLRSQGIESVFFALDPHPIVAKWAVGAKQALLVDRCDPSAFEVLKDAEVRVYSLANDGGKFLSGSSTATAAFNLAATLGYRDVTFYGCESCYVASSHAYQDEARVDQMLVECGGYKYLTAPDYYIQAQELAQLIKAAPKHFRERSGGLLRAMILNDEHDVIAVSQSLHDAIDGSGSE